MGGEGGGGDAPLWKGELEFESALGWDAPLHGVKVAGVRTRFPVINLKNKTHSEEHSVRCNILNNTKQYNKDCLKGDLW